MVKIISGNILDVKEGIILHQVNCKRVMGAGLAKQLKNKWMNVYVSYINRPSWKLEDIQFVKVEKNLWVCNLASQDDYNRSRDNRVYTNYKAMLFGMKKVYEYAKEMELQVYVPYKIGCGLANGNWGIVMHIIETAIPDAIIVKKD